MPAAAAAVDFVVQNYSRLGLGLFDVRPGRTSERQIQQQTNNMKTLKTR